jgi:hypothetical protein
MSSSHEVGEIFGDGNGPASALLRSPTVIIAAIGLWGMNVYLFRLFGIDHVHVLTLDLNKEKETGNDRRGRDHRDDANKIIDSPSSSSSISPSPASGSASKDRHVHRDVVDAEVTWPRLVVLSLSLLLLLHLTAILWIDLIGGSTIGALFAFYATVAIGVALPLPSTAWMRHAIYIIFQRTIELLTPRCYCLQAGIPRSVPFVDVFFADILCSLSKVFFDWGMLWHVSFFSPISCDGDSGYENMARVTLPRPRFQADFFVIAH